MPKHHIVQLYSSRWSRAGARRSSRQAWSCRPAWPPGEWGTQSCWSLTWEQQDGSANISYMQLYPICWHINNKVMLQIYLVCKYIQYAHLPTTRRFCRYILCANISYMLTYQQQGDSANTSCMQIYPICSPINNNMFLQIYLLCKYILYVDISTTRCFYKYILYVVCCTCQEGRNQQLREVCLASLLLPSLVGWGHCAHTW